ncbi:MAG: DinB family protein [Oscillospiraceae bacterium]|nr:DinB family protein [Oscillospiraceae bacterium]
MYSVATNWNPKQKKLREALSDINRFDEAISVCLELHGIVHTSCVSAAKTQTYMDEIWDGLNRETFASPLAEQNAFGRKSTIAWNVWHITRIEDITTNILISEAAQVLDKHWLKRMGITITETGNAMSDTEIMNFSNSVSLNELCEYRNAVALRTREILNGLAPQDIKKRFKPEILTRILNEGGVTSDEKSIWLLDFWGKKNVAGILLMPVTRHQIVHLNECMRIKEKITKNSKRGK